MDDKQVGEQWRLWTRVIKEDGHQPMTYAHAARFLQFINKLVDERVETRWTAIKLHHAHREEGAKRSEKASCLVDALRDFGINPADYKD